MQLGCISYAACRGGKTKVLILFCQFYTIWYDYWIMVFLQLSIATTV